MPADAENSLTPTQLEETLAALYPDQFSQDARERFWVVRTKFALDLASDLDDSLKNKNGGRQNAQLTAADVDSAYSARLRRGSYEATAASSLVSAAFGAGVSLFASDNRPGWLVSAVALVFLGGLFFGGRSFFLRSK